MARLNDPPVPAIESIDALKRRFIRQNREIARVNSNQSMRIRNLEAEISRLLSENISLREQAIAAAADAERWRSSDRLGRDVLIMKERLEAKLLEVNALVGEFGRLPEKAARRSSILRRRTRPVSEMTKSPNERDWRNRPTLGGGCISGDNEIHDGRLPAIMEDKYYPRRTLETTEIRRISTESRNDDISESPDLGPPPTVHFEVSEAIAFDTEGYHYQGSGEVEPESDTINGLLPTNLETRRKRRTSSLLQNLAAIEDEASNIQEPAELANQVQTSTKSGAKRKLDVSELEDTSNRPSKELEEFVYQRKSTATTKSKPSRFTKPPTPQEHRQGIELTTTTTTSPPKLSSTRKILAPKSTNSPAKRRIDNLSEKPDIPAAQKDEKPTNPAGAFKRKIMVPLAREQPIQTENIQIESTENQEGLPPKTPAAALADMLSPTSVPTAPSTKPTFVEMAMTNSVEDVLNGSIGRGSRRVRAAVSYAEPNLRDKMRRPGKALVGAVEGLGKSGNPDRESIRDGSVDLDGEIGSETTRVVKLAKVKTENTEDEADEDQRWKTLPMEKKEEAASPLRDKNKKISARTMNEAAGRKPHPRTDTTSVMEKQGEVGLEKAVSRLSLSVFDPPSSSPMRTTSTMQEPDATTLPHPSSKPTPSTTRPASTNPHPTRPRRHSIQPQPQPSQTRPSSAASVRRIERDTELKQNALKRSASVTTLPDAKDLGKDKLLSRASRLNLQSNGSQAQPRQYNEDASSAADQTASRRRSMMV